MNTRALALGGKHMTLLRALAFPLHMASLLFIAASSLILALLPRWSNFAILVAIIPVYMMMVWLTQFAFTMIDDVANGRREAAAASMEMLSPFGDPRCWVHPALAAGIALLLYNHPDLPRLPILASAWLLFPGSIGALAVSSRILDAFNPLTLWRVTLGLGPYYLLLLGGTLLAAVLGMWILRSGLWGLLRIALAELVLLECYALIGGTLYLRRRELGFEPVSSPERELQKAEAERQLRRQRMFDDVYRKLRVRETAKAVAVAQQWLEPLSVLELQGDVAALLQASRSWSEPRAFGNFAQGFIPQLLAARQPALGLATAEEGMRQAESFAVTSESVAIELALYALQTGRKRVARAVLQNFVAKLQDQAAGSEVLALQQRLADGPGVS